MGIVLRVLLLNIWVWVVLWCFVLVFLCFGFLCKSLLEGWRVSFVLFSCCFVFLRNLSVRRFLLRSYLMCCNLLLSMRYDHIFEACLSINENVLSAFKNYIFLFLLFVFFCFQSCNSVDSACPTLHVERLCFEMDKSYEETKLQLLLSPAVLLVKDTVVVGK